MHQAVASTVRFSREEALLIITGAAICAAIAITYHVLGFSVIRSDVRGYADWSHHLFEHRVKYHLPGYPTLIALSRVLTLGWVGDAVLMQGLAFICWVISLRVLSLTLEKVSPESKRLGLLLFGLYPFVGVAYIVYPIADILASLLLIGAFYCALRKLWWPFVLIAAYGLLVHKALWPFLFLLMLACMVWMGMPRWHLALAGAPLAIYYLIMTPPGKNPLWILRWHLDRELTSQSSFPVFDGILGTLIQGSMKGMFKGGVLFLVFLSTVFLGLYLLKRKECLLLALITPLVIFAVTLNQHEAWALLRFSKVLVIPLCVWLVVQGKRGIAPRQLSAYIGLAAVLIVTNIAWAAYIMMYFDSGPFQ